MMRRMVLLLMYILNFQCFKTFYGFTLSTCILAHSCISKSHDKDKDAGIHITFIAHPKKLMHVKIHKKLVSFYAKRITNYDEGPLNSTLSSSSSSPAIVAS